MEGLIGFWSHTLAALAFAGLCLSRAKEASRQPDQRLLLGAFAVTACWAWLTAIDPQGGLSRYAETARNFFWVGLLYAFSSADIERQRGVRPVYAAVAAVLGMQLVATSLVLAGPSPAVLQTAFILRLSAAAGALVLIHNFYGQATAATRSNIHYAIVGLTVMWLYDLNLYTIQYFIGTRSVFLNEWRGLAVAFTAPLFALGSRAESGWRVRLSRSATFQSLSLLAICAYFALMAVVTTALRGANFNWSSSVGMFGLAAMTLGAMAIASSPGARGRLKVYLAKHMFEHRYDYRREWLRFTDTLGSLSEHDASLTERIVKAFADLVDAPGGLLLVGGPDAMTTAASWNWTSPIPAFSNSGDGLEFWGKLESSGRILELDALRNGWSSPTDKALEVPAWLVEDRAYWVGIPLIHRQRLIGIVLLAEPDYARSLDWEDFDLLRTAGRQAASALAEALGQEALANAQRFEEFNRRFAFILHDIKNLVSQLSLLARNAQRHADNPAFRADMVATLQSSVGKMNDLLTRLSPQSQGRIQQSIPQPLRPIVAEAIAARRGDREIQLSGETSLWVKVDSAALEQALGHLVQNAIEASPLTEPILVNITAVGDQIEITIVDEGCGMDGDFIRNRLFQPFASSKSSGFGIGAYEARSIIASMSGHLNVHSNPGAGTTFTILLPAARPDARIERKRA